MWWEHKGHPWQHCRKGICLGTTPSAPTPALLAGQSTLNHSLILGCQTSIERVDRSPNETLGNKPLVQLDTIWEWKQWPHRKMSWPWKSPSSLGRWWTELKGGVSGWCRQLRQFANSPPSCCVTIQSFKEQEEYLYPATEMRHTWK